MDRYDFIIYGASGFTGQYVVEYVYRAAKEHGISWAVSGRNEGRLLTVLKQAGAAVRDDLSQIPMIICDCSSPDSLLAMARQANVVLNCVGPYRFFGDPVVHACVEAGAHHVDISGEPAFLEKMQLKYHQKATENGVYVVGSCGFDSIPSDVGQMVVKNNMEGDLNSVETFLSVSIPNLPGPALNFGTWQSAIYGFAHAKELKSIRRSLYPEKLPSATHKLKPRGNLFYSDEVESWCIPFFGSDKSVMARTQRELYHSKQEHPTQIQCYVQMTWWNALLTMVAGLMFMVLASFKFGRKLLEDYPGFFSFGAVSKDGVPKEKADETNFELTLIGRGWATKGNHEEKPDRLVTAVVAGKNVGYGSTCECMVQAALVILQEQDKLPSVGGVYTPGYAFAETSLVERLNKHGVTFKVAVNTL